MPSKRANKKKIKIKGEFTTTVREPAVHKVLDLNKVRMLRELVCLLNKWLGQFTNHRKQAIRSVGK